MTAQCRYKVSRPGYEHRIEKMNKSNITVKKVLLTISSWAVLALVAHGQSVDRHVTVPAGDYYQSSKHSLSVTIGEPVTGTLSSGSHILTQGFQQGTWAVELVDSCENPPCDSILPPCENPPCDTLSVKGNELLVKMWPNPATNHVNISLDHTAKGNYTFVLLDVQGKAIQTGRLEGNNATIDLQGLPGNIYLVRVGDKQSGEFLTFRLIKQ